MVKKAVTVLMAVCITVMLCGCAQTLPLEDSNPVYTDYTFRNAELLEKHYEKHGKEMGFSDPESYEKAASDVINNPDALHKTEAEDGDDVYYLTDTNEFTIVSKDGYIRTYFCPDAGKKYYDRQ